MLGTLLEMSSILLGILFELLDYRYQEDVHFGAQKSGIEGNKQRTKPQNHKYIKKCLLRIPLCAQCSQPSREQRYEQWSPQIPLSLKFLIISLP